MMVVNGKEVKVLEDVVMESYGVEFKYSDGWVRGCVEVDGVMYVVDDEKCNKSKELFVKWVESGDCWDGVDEEEL